MDVTILLADAAQVADGKLYILGGGIQMVGAAPPHPLAIALLIRVPWDQANVSHSWQLELLDEDGHPILHDERPVMVGGQFEAGRPAGWPAGTPLQVPVGINFHSLPVVPGHRYAWRLAIDGTSEPGWQVGFGVGT